MTSKQVAELLWATLQKYLDNPRLIERAAKRVSAALSDQVDNIDSVLGADPSYRDALIIQLAYGVLAEEPLDLTRRQKGGRTVAMKLGAFLAKSHIRHVKDALQNIGKNTADLTRGNVAEFDSFLRWASRKATTREQLRRALDYACGKIAATARPVTPMPPLDIGALTYGAIAPLFRNMFSAGSQGAHEQFTVAALLHALVGQVGVQGYRVETKSLNASDRSSRVAGDVQVMTGNRIVEAYEVTAADWASKVNGAEQAIRDNDLSRIHILAAVEPRDEDELLRRLVEIRADISVLDLWSFTSALVAALTRRHRAVALERLYEFLDRYQPDTAKVNAYVEMLASHGLTMQG